MKKVIEAAEIKLSLKIEGIKNKINKQERENTQLKLKMEIIKQNKKKNNIIILD